MSSSPATHPSQSAVSLKAILTTALIAGVISSVVNLILLFAGSALVGDINISQAPGAAFAPVPFFIVIAATLVPTLLAGVGLWVARRFLPKGNLIFIIGVAVITLLSMAGPFGEMVETTSGSVVLALMHVVVGGMMIWYMALRN